jgi:nucleoside 2-deoxyribosyltransferase
MDERVWAEVGVVDHLDLQWVIASLENQKLLKEWGSDLSTFRGNLTASGWERLEELQRAHVASNYAFFARKFSNTALDTVYETCLRPTVRETGFELQTVTQRAGHIDAIIEDEIRRCKFLIADLSDDNAGAYWEAGFAEGLGKPVIYICREKTADGNDMKTHFDTEHRHTIRWDLATLDETAKQLKAVIRNTLLGDAK